MNWLSIKKTEFYEYCSCNSCGAQNYDSTYTAKSVDTLYEVRIGGMVNRLCPDCLAQLIGLATVALASENNK